VTLERITFAVDGKIRWFNAGGDLTKTGAAIVGGVKSWLFAPRE
jgi:hypothetical protein